MLSILNRFLVHSILYKLNNFQQDLTFFCNSQPNLNLGNILLVFTINRFSCDVLNLEWLRFPLRDVPNLY
jgi:hypothetical protein